MAGFAPKIYKSRRKESRRRESPGQKISWFLGNFCFYETKLPFSEKLADFRVTLNNFFVSMLISWYWSEVIVFRFYQEMNAVRFENSEVSQGISRILKVFGKIIVYLRKMIVGLKNVNCKKVHILAISRKNCKFCSY